MSEVPVEGDAPEPLDLTVFFPAWNESASIVAAVTAAATVLRSMEDDGIISGHEVLVVDDGSTDGMDAVLARIAAEMPELRVIRHPVNRGVGPAMRTGLGAARGKLVFYTDADLPVDLAALPSLLEVRAREGADVVAGYRRTRRHETPRRRMYGASYNLLVRLVLGLRVRDVNFAAKLLTADVLARLPLRSESIFIDAEMLARADRAGLKIVEVPLDYQLRVAGESSTSSFRQIRRLLRELCTLGPEIRRGA